LSGAFGPEADTRPDKFEPSLTQAVNDESRPHRRAPRPSVHIPTKRRCFADDLGYRGS